jgi:hypothetical protein
LRFRVIAAATVAAVGLIACGPAVPEAPSPVALEYRAPMVEQMLYTVADTATFSVDSGAMGVMAVTAAFVGTAHLRLVGEGDHVAGEIRFLSFHGSFDAEPHAVHPVDERDIDGSFTVRIDPRGRYELVDTPRLSQDLLDVASAESMVRPLFVYLPARPAAAGDQWVDTVTTVERGDGTVTRARSVITTTLVGDTLVDGRPLLLLRTRAENEIEVAGGSGGVAVRQRMSGVTTGTVVWDDRLHLLIERREEGHLTGTLDMEGTAAGGLPLTAEVRRTVVLER